MPIRIELQLHNPKYFQFPSGGGLSKKQTVCHLASFYRVWIMEYGVYRFRLAYVTHERALSPADLFGGKAPVGPLIGLLERIC
jgi:hypothetical protein